jgi:hypothetical protein
LHKDELNADWALAISGEEPYKINPLWGFYVLGCHFSEATW